MLSFSSFILFKLYHWIKLDHSENFIPIYQFLIYCLSAPNHHSVPCSVTLDLNPVNISPLPAGLVLIFVNRGLQGPCQGDGGRKALPFQVPVLISFYSLWKSVDQCADGPVGLSSVAVMGQLLSPTWQLFLWQLWSHLLVAISLPGWDACTDQMANAFWQNKTLPLYTYQIS